MKKRQKYSAISYVVALLALSSPIAAAPADVSGDRSLQPQSTKVGDHSIYYAMNRYPINPEPIIVSVTQRTDTRANQEKPYDEQFLYVRELKMNAELNGLIESKGF